jgi:hypothetical protein
MQEVTAMRVRQLNRESALRNVRQVFFIVTCAAMLQCCSEGQIESPTGPNSPSNSLLQECPVLPATITTLLACSTGSTGLALTEPTLVCGGDGKMHIATSNPDPRTDGLRVTVVLQQISSFKGEIVATTPSILDGSAAITCGAGRLNLSPFQADFGLTYTGDRGFEVNTTTPCILQSKINYSLFHIRQEGFAGFDGAAKDALHKQIDASVIGFLNSLSSLPPPASGSVRCMRWREMP